MTSMYLRKYESSFDWSDDSVLMDGAPHQRRAAAGVLCGGECVKGVARHPPLKVCTGQGLLKQHHIEVLKDGLQYLVLLGS